MDSCAEPPVPAHAADRTTHTYAWCQDCTRRVQGRLAQTRPEQEILPLPGIDGWRVHPTLPIPSDLPRTKEAPVPGSLLLHRPLRNQSGRQKKKPCDSRQESGGRWAKYKEGSGPRM